MPEHGSRDAQPVWAANEAGSLSVDLWTVDLDRWNGTRLDPRALSERDLAQAERLRDPQKVRRLLARRSVTRAVVASALGIEPRAVEIERTCPTCGSTEHGRPYVPGSNILFSVSSSGELAVVAVSVHPVGVDIELAEGDIAPQPKSLAPDEGRALAELPPDRRSDGFLRLWTAKEAVLKAGNRSLSDDPATIDVVAVLSSDSTPVSDNGQIWHVRHLPIRLDGGRHAIVAVAGPHETEVACQWIE
jgi:4'-phosphopantetheinyl transferase